MLRADVVVAFPMSTFIYANLISILNVLYVWVYGCMAECVCVCISVLCVLGVCVSVCVCVCENSLCCAQLPWFYLLLATVFG